MLKYKVYLAHYTYNTYKYYYSTYNMLSKHLRDYSSIYPNERKRPCTILQDKINRLCESVNKRKFADNYVADYFIYFTNGY